MKVRKLLAALLLAAAAAPAPAQANLPEGKWWKRPRLAEEIGLTPEQQDQIDKIFVRSRTKLIDLRADLEKKQLAFQEAMEDRSADRKDVESKIEAVENARGQLQKTRALMILDMKRVLKPEQWTKLLRRRQELRERRQWKGDGMRPEGRGRGRPEPRGDPG